MLLYMKRITIELNDETYSQIKLLTKWLNLNTTVKNKKNIPKDYNEKEIVRGMVIEKVKELNHFYEIHPILNEDINKDTNIKNRFKEIAKEKGISQKQISEQLGIYAPALSSIFNNESQPRTKIFLQLWLVLGCPPLHECIYIED